VRVLLGSYAQGRRKRARTPGELDLAEARIDVVRLGWGRPDPTYRQIFISRFLPDATQEQWRSFDELQRRSTSPENAWRFVGEFANIDVTDLAPKLTVPTLIMCSRREPDNAFEQSRMLAALIPHSRLVPLILSASGAGARARGTAACVLAGPAGYAAFDAGFRQVPGSVMAAPRSTGTRSPGRGVMAVP